MPKYVKDDLLSTEFQANFFSQLKNTDRDGAMKMLQNTVNLLKERGVEAADYVIQINHDLMREGETGLDLEVMLALNFATQKHNRQIRKHPTLKVPYVVHLYDVCARMLSFGITDREILVAGVIHDVLEDTDCEKIDIIKMFGRRIANIVTQVSEDSYAPGEVKPSKSERKQRYVSQIKNAPESMSEAVAVVSAVDKMSNGWDWIVSAEEGQHLDAETRDLQFNFYCNLMPVYVKKIENYPMVITAMKRTWEKLQEVWIPTNCA